MADLLTIQTDKPRDVVRIDGVEYALADVEDMALGGQQRVLRNAKRWQELAAQSEDGTSLGDLTDAEYDELDGLMDGLYRVALPDLPDDVAARLSAGAKVRIVLAFAQRLSGGAGAADGQTPPETGSENGLTQSPDSNDSTEEPPPAG